MKVTKDGKKKKGNTPDLHGDLPWSSVLGEAQCPALASSSGSKGGDMALVRPM